MVVVTRGQVSRLSSARGGRDGAEARASVWHRRQERRSEEDTMRYLLAALFATLVVSGLGAFAA
jgi:hypothetical protein